MDMMELSDMSGPRSAMKPTKFDWTASPKSVVHESSLEEHVILNQHSDDDVKDNKFQCTECFASKQLTKYFATQQILHQHIIQVHNPPRFKCQVCFKAFNNSSNFRRHERTHSQSSQAEIKRYKCDLCDKTYAQNVNLTKHLLSVHKRKCGSAHYFQCELCGQEFVGRPALEAHVIRQHVVDKSFQCPVCSKTFIDQETLEKHMKKHDTMEKYFCNVCSKGFKHKRSLVRHLGMEHRKFFYCDKCDRSFKNKSEYDGHISDSEQELKCYICQEIINSECLLKIHTDSHVNKFKTERIDIKTAGNQTEPSETEDDLKNKLELKKETLFQCELCFKTFDREAYFKSHRLVMHLNAEWKCNIEQCSRTFKWYSQFRLHQLMHGETKEYVCSICQKSFYRPDSLKDHERIHIADKAYPCKMCPKSFIQASILRAHVANNHGGCKPFKCPVTNCGTSWATNSLLTDHLVSHQTERPFECDMCATFKAFKSRKQLRYHQRTVHSDTKKGTSKERK